MNMNQKVEQLKYIKSTYETCYYLVQILNAVYHNPYLKDQFLLKGSAAVSSYLENYKRLFSDIDLDFNTPIDRTHMPLQREHLRQHFLASLEPLHLSPSDKKSRFSYSVDSYEFPIFLENGGQSCAKVDINYSYGNHLYEPMQRNVVNSDFDIEYPVVLLNLEELLGMKLKSLLDRFSIRDLFDLYHLIVQYPNINMEKVRKAYIFYFTINGKRGLIEFEKIFTLQRKDCIRNLYPYIPKKYSFDLEKIQQKVFDFSVKVLQMTEEELYFIEQFDIGNYCPQYLFSDLNVLEKISYVPIIDWKMQNKKKK